jgi:hypothetical protein
MAWEQLDTMDPGPHLLRHCRRFCAGYDDANDLDRLRMDPAF